MLSISGRVNSGNGPLRTSTAFGRTSTIRKVSSDDARKQLMYGEPGDCTRLNNKERKNERNEKSTRKKIL